MFPIPIYIWDLQFQSTSKQGEEQHPDQHCEFELTRKMRIQLLDSCSRRAVSMVAGVALPTPPKARKTCTVPMVPLHRRGGAGWGGWNWNIIDDFNGDDVGLVAILGATGAGKTKLSIDVGTRVPSEVINSDKIQVYSGLDVTTNKAPVGERCGVPHHLLGELDPAGGEMKPAEFRAEASERIAAIRSRRRLPVLAGGSNSLVCELLLRPRGGDNDNDDLFSLGRGLTYRCCLLWVDVGREVLEEYLDRRVDEMVGTGMVEELARHFDVRRALEGRYEGLEKAIGVREFDSYFLKYRPPLLPADGGRKYWRRGEREEFDRAVEEVKEETRALARRQVGKIERMRRELGWEMRRLDATEAIARKVEGKGKEDVEEAWARDVLAPAMVEVGMFLEEGDRRRSRRREAAATVAGSIQRVTARVTRILHHPVL